MKRKSEPVMTVGAANCAPVNRRAEAWNSVSVPTSFANCFGKLFRDKGQSRVPEPPQSSTGVTVTRWLVRISVTGSDFVMVRNSWVMRYRQPH
jgi:hypothetical protein